MFKKNSYSIVFMDCHMPVCDGAASCSQLAGIDLVIVLCVLALAMVLAGFESTRLMRAWEASVGRQAVPIVAMSGDDFSGNKLVESRVSLPLCLVKLLYVRWCVQTTRE